MKDVILKKGDDAWFHNGGKNNPLMKGKVEEVIRLDGYGFDHYIISYPTGVDDMLVVRCGTSVSDSPNRPIGLWRRGDTKTYLNKILGK